MTSLHFVLYSCLEIYMVTHNTKDPDYVFTMSLKQTLDFFP